MAERKIVEEVTNAKLYSDGTILVQDIRNSYPHVDAAWSQNEGEKKKFSVVGMVPKDTHKAAHDLVKRVIDKMMSELVAQKKIPAALKADARFLRDGDDSGKPDYAGYWTINASEDTAPAVRDAARNKITDSAAIKKLFVPGHRIDLLLRPWFQDNKYGKKINANLLAVRYRRKDEILGEGVRLADDDIDQTFDDDIEDNGDDSFDESDIAGL